MVKRGMGYEYWIGLKIHQYEVDSPAARRGRDTAIAPRSGPPAMSQPLVEVLIPTFNEAGQICDAVTNAFQLGPVFVLDSFSTDGTQVLARRAGATVVDHLFEGYTHQKNWGLANLPFRGQWVFILGAAERITPALVQEVLSRAADPKSSDAFFVKRLMLYTGRPIRHGGLYPAWSLRFFRRGHCRYEDRSVHDQMICDGITDYMNHQILHIRCETIEQYVNKQIYYADLESSEKLRLKTRQSQGSKDAILISHTPRYWQWVRRNFWPALTAKPLWRFLSTYFFRFGFLDGRPGWHLAVLAACYEYMISMIYREKLHRVVQAEKASNARREKLDEWRR